MGWRLIIYFWAAGMNSLVCEWIETRVLLRNGLDQTVQLWDWTLNSLVCSEFFHNSCCRWWWRRWWWWQTESEIKHSSNLQTHLFKASARVEVFVSKHQLNELNVSSPTSNTNCCKVKIKTSQFQPFIPVFNTSLGDKGPDEKPLYTLDRFFWRAQTMRLCVVNQQPRLSQTLWYQEWCLCVWRREKDEKKEGKKKVELKESLQTFPTIWGSLMNVCSAESGSNECTKKRTENWCLTQVSRHKFEVWFNYFPCKYTSMRILLVLLLDASRNSKKQWKKDNDKCKTNMHYVKI